MAVASLILGILGLSGWVILLGIISGTLTALPGLILGIIALRKKRGKKGMAIAGIILSCIGLAGVAVNIIGGGLSYMF